MKKTIHPLRLVRLNEYRLDKHIPAVEERNGRVVQDEEEANILHNGIAPFQDGLFVMPTIQHGNNKVTTDMVSTKNTTIDHMDEGRIAKVESMTPLVDVTMSQTHEGKVPTSEVEAQHLLKRTPNSYLLNQIYGLWFFVSWFFLTVIITRKISTNDYGTFAIALTVFNTVAYIVALGLEDAITTYVPKTLAEHGQAAAAALIRRLLILRFVTLVVTFGVMLFGLPVLATLISLIPLQGSADTAAGMRNSGLLAHILPIAIYVVGNGISSLLTSVCASLMRMRPVFAISGLTQVLLLGMGFAVLQLGWGANGMLWLLAISSLLNAAAFAIWLAPLLILRGSTYKQPFKPVVNLGVSAWLTNLASGALLKQVSIILLVYFAATQTQIGFFNLSFQLAHSANLLLVTGFAGVGGSALAAAFIGHNYQRLAHSWQTLIKIETLLAAPLLVFCLFNAQNIAHTLYGSNYDPVGPLLAIFLFFNIFVRVLGTTIHQSTLYVIGKPRLVVLSQWIGLVTVLLIGLALIPRFGAAGALVSDGLSQVATGGLLLAFLWRNLPRKYPLGFTLRLLLALALAALPSIVWHPTGRILLGIAGTVFLVLCVGLLLWIRPLGAEDMEMVGGLNPRLVRYLRWFARHAQQKNF